MNKKLSLMMAAILAAGYSVTAEAGIYKVTAAGDVVSGYKYVVATNNMAEVLSASSASAVVSNVPFATGDENFLWIVEGDGNFKLINVGQSTESKKLYLTKNTAAAALGEDGKPYAAATFTEDTRFGKAGIKTNDGSTNDSFVLGGASPAFGASSEDANLHIETKAKYSDAAVVYVKFGEKYAVHTGTGTVIYLDGTTIAMLGLGEKAKFQIEGNKIKSVSDNTYGISDIDDGTISLSTNIPTVDKDANNTDNTNVYLTADGGITTKATDASTFVLETTAPSKAIQVPAGALAWTSGTTGVLCVTAAEKAGDIDTKKSIDESGGLADFDGSSVALTVKQNGNGTYSLFDAEEQQVKLDGSEATFAIERVPGTNGFTIKKNDGEVLTIVAEDLSAFAWTTNGVPADGNTIAVFSFSKGELAAISVVDLIAIQNGTLPLTASYDNGKTDFKGENPFTGSLTIEQIQIRAYEVNKFYLKSGDKYIVGRPGLIAGSGSLVCGFVTVNDLAKDMQVGDVAVFTAETYAGEKTPSEVALTLDGVGEVGYYMVNGKDAYVGAGASPSPITFSLNGSTGVAVAKWQDVLQKGKFFTVEKISNYKNEKTAKVEGYLVADQTTDENYAYSKTVRNVLEGEWALTLDNPNDPVNYVFTNRETPTIQFKGIAVANLYTTATEYTYVVGADKYIITPVANHAATDGYQRLDQLDMQRFNIGSYAGVYGNTAWFTENHGEDKTAEWHVIGLKPEQEDGLVFEAIAHTKASTKTAATDSVYVISTIGYFNNATKFYDVVLDTLKVVSYTFKNQYGEPLYVNTDDFTRDTYVSAVDKKTDTKFTLRLDTENTLNLRPVALAAAANYNTFEATDFNKAYAGSSVNEGLVSSTDLYERGENDRFVIAPLAYEMYRRLENAVPGTSLDTVSIYRQGNNKEVLFENGMFLGMNNQVQFPAIAPAMVADSAYAPATTYRPQYMLMVEPNYVPAGTWCPEHGYNPGCSHATPIAGYTEGRYLVNLKDTARAWEDANKHGGINPYTNSENYVKLAFVPAKHIGDTLIIQSDSNKLIVNTKEFNEAKFAFRYVDADAKSFYIETADYNLADGKIKETPGYLKWMNGVIVVVDNIQNADVYNMTEDYEGNPTANEGINAASVSVIAGNGSVTINGAAGKKVTISNVLGQTVANTVLSSDNATVSAPQGIVVVAVEGEAAVKAIVK